MFREPKQLFMFNKKASSATYICISILISFISAWVATLLFNSYREKSLLFLLEVDLETSTSGNWELFWDSGEGFSAQESFRFHTRNPHVRSLGYFKLPSKTIQGLRLDPLDVMGEVTIYQIRIVDALGRDYTEVFKAWDYSPLSGIESVEESEDGLKFKFNSADPALLLHYNKESLNRLLVMMGEQRSITGSLVVSFSFCLFCLLGFYLFGNWFLPVILSFLCWSIFYPGVFSPDSISHIWEANRGTFYNWHPAIMPIALRFLFGLGIPVEAIILVQSLIGNLVILWVLHEFWRILDDSRFPGRHSLLIMGCALTVFAFLYSPLTPFYGFSLALWKDVWFTTTVLSIVGLTLNTKPLVYDRISTSDYPIWIRLALLTFLMGLSLCLRGNAIVLIPVFVGIIWVLAGRFRVWVRIMFSLIALVFFLYGGVWINKVFKVEDLNPRASVMSLELVGLLKLKPTLQEEFPYIASQLKEGWQHEFEWASYRKMRWNENSFVMPDLVKTGPNRPLEDAYFRAVKRHPFLMSKVKLLNFLQVINPFETTEWLPAGVAENDYGLKMNLYAESFYKTYWHWSHKVSSHPILRWISAVHLIWFLMAILILGYLLRRFIILRDSYVLLLLLLSSIPCAYVFSYFLASPWTAFRYMYPSTLLIQIFLIVWAFQKLIAYSRKLTNRTN